LAKQPLKDLDDFPEYMPPPMAAELIGVSVQTLANWRWARKGPRYKRYGRNTIRYGKRDLVEFAENEVSEVAPESPESDAQIIREIARLATRLARRLARAPR
jgi:hypothetical protein